MSQPINRFLAALRARGCVPKQSGREWTCTCPAHADRAPSLSFRVGDDGGALVHCFAGCTFAEIVRAVGLTIGDIMPERTALRRRGTSSRIRASALPAVKGHEKPVKTYPTLDEGIARNLRPQWTHTRTWHYRDRTSSVVGAVVRWDTPRGKVVRPFSVRGDLWVMAAMPAPRPLFNLPELAGLPDGARVYIAEGEKTAEAARSRGLITTTSAGGCGAADLTDWSVLRNKQVIVLPDNDEAGEKYASDVVRLCLRAGADEVRVVRLVDRWPDLPEKGDLADVL